MRPCVLLALAGVTLMACGISAVGAGGPDGGSAADATAPAPDADGGTPPGDDDVADASTGAIAEAGPCTTTETTCTAALAAGWTPLAYASDRTTGCPAGFKTIDLVTSPVAAAGACTCGCQISAADPPSCAEGIFTSKVGSTSSCSNNGISYNVNGTGCTQLSNSGGISAFGDYAALPLSRGTCTSSVRKDMTKLDNTTVRACEPPPACSEEVCRGDIGAPYGSCVVHDGDVACPSGPFQTKAVVGSTATLTCGGCATCQNSATCGPATLRFYDDNACATQVASRLADGTCIALATGTAGVNASHFRYDVATTNPTCAPTSTATTAAGLEQTRTVCCR